MLKTFERKLDKVLSEAQIDYLARKYGDQISPELIQKAIEISNKDAEKLIYAYINGSITDITPEQLPNVANINLKQKPTQSEYEIKSQKFADQLKKITDNDESNKKSDRQINYRQMDDDAHKKHQVKNLAVYVETQIRHGQENPDYSTKAGELSKELDLDPHSLIKSFAKYDPTVTDENGNFIGKPKGTYTNWIMKIVLQGINANNDPEEDGLRYALERFEKYKASNRFTAEKEISKYPSLQSLVSTLDRYEEATQEQSSLLNRSTVQQIKKLEKYGESFVHMIHEDSMFKIEYINPDEFEECKCSPEGNTLNGIEYKTNPQCKWLDLIALNVRSVGGIWHGYDWIPAHLASKADLEINDKLKESCIRKGQSAQLKVHISPAILGLMCRSRKVGSGWCTASPYYARHYTQKDGRGGGTDRGEVERLPIYLIYKSLTPELVNRINELDNQYPGTYVNKTIEQVDPSTGEVIKKSVIDPATGEPRKIYLPNEEKVIAKLKELGLKVSDRDIIKEIELKTGDIVYNEINNKSYRYVGQSGVLANLPSTKYGPPDWELVNDKVKPNHVVGHPERIPFVLANYEFDYGSAAFNNRDDDKMTKMTSKLFIFLCKLIYASETGVHPFSGGRLDIPKFYPGALRNIYRLASSSGGGTKVGNEWVPSKSAITELLVDRKKKIEERKKAGYDTTEADKLINMVEFVVELMKKASR